MSEWDPVWLERQQRDAARWAREIMESDLRRQLTTSPKAAKRPAKPKRRGKPA